MEPHLKWCLPVKDKQTDDWRQHKVTAHSADDVDVVWGSGGIDGISFPSNSTFYCPNTTDSFLKDYLAQI